LDEAEKICLIGNRNNLAAVDDDRLADKTSLYALARQQPKHQGERAPWLRVSR